MWKMSLFNNLNYQHLARNRLTGKYTRKCHSEIIKKIGIVKKKYDILKEDVGEWRQQRTAGNSMGRLMSSSGFLQADDIEERI